MYDAFGVRQLGGQTGDPFGFGAQWGYYTDTEMGLSLLTWRHYDPASGRFLTRDPIGYAGRINLYGYVGNNPANFIDPLGLSQKPRGMKPGDIGLSFSGFIPTPYAKGPWPLSNAEGDGRGFSSNSNDFRAQYQIILRPDGRYDGWGETGRSTPLFDWQGPPTHAPADNMGMRAYYCGDGNWEIFLKGSADYPFAASPHIDFNLHITVVNTG